jgi:hypothetical protein
MGGGYHYNSLSNGSVRSGKAIMSAEIDVPFTDLYTQQSSASENV